MGSHAAALRGQGADQDLVDAIGTGDLTKVKLSPKDRELLKFVKLITLNSSHTTDDDVQAMRDVGWTDEQIWETSIEVGTFSFLNRMADVYGLDYPSGGWYPPELRPKTEGGKPPEQPAANPADKTPVKKP